MQPLSRETSMLSPVLCSDKSSAIEILQARVSRSPGLVLQFQKPVVDAKQLPARARRESDLRYLPATDLRYRRRRAELCPHSPQAIVPAADRREPCPLAV